MGKFRDYLNEARATSVPTEYRIALGQLKRMYNPGEVPSEKELQKDAEMIAKKNHLEEDKFLEFAKSQFKMNESSNIKLIIDKSENTPVVFKNHTLGILNKRDNRYVLDILQASKSSGSTFSNKQGYVELDISDINNKDLRLATKKDFEDFKVDSKGYKLNESAVGTPGRTTIKDAEDHINDELVAEFKKIIKKLGGKTVAKVLLDKLGQKAEIKDEIEHIEDIIDNSNY